METAKKKLVLNASLRVRARFDFAELDFNRLEVRTGITDKRKVRALQVFVDELVTNRNFTALRELRDGKREALHRLKEREDNGLTVVLTAQRSGLIAALEDWIAAGPEKKNQQPVQPTTLSTYATSVKGLADMLAAERKTAEDKAKGNVKALAAIEAKAPQVADLPDVLTRYRTACAKLKHFRPFDLARGACAAFARQTEPKGKHSALYIDIQKVPPFSEPKKRQRNASLSVADVIAIMERMTQQGNEHFAEHVWQLASFGARPREYCRDTPTSAAKIEYDAGTDSVRIHGTKTIFADRFCPLTEHGSPVNDDGDAIGVNFLVWRTGKLAGRQSGKGKQNFYTYRTFAKAFKAAAPGYQPYDLRGVSQRWMLDAGISENWVARFHGHVPDSLQREYTSVQFPPLWEEWDSAILEASEKINAWMTRQMDAVRKCETPAKRVWGARARGEQAA